VKARFCRELGHKRPNSQGLNVLVEGSQLKN